MKEGVEIKIPLKGIVRNQPRTSGDNGNLDEIINLRWKDNSWRPTPLLKPIVGLDVVNYGFIYIHTNDYSHVLGARGNVLYWFGNITYADNKTSGETFEIPKKVCDIKDIKDIKQNGNLISIIDSTGIQYVLFDEDKNTYIAFNLDYNGAKNAISLLPEGMIDLKVEGVYKEKDGVKIPLRSFLFENMNTEGLKGAPLLDNYGQYVYGDTHNTLYERIMPTVEKAFALAKKNNLFSQGYFLACTALELYDGTYILMSRPVLMSPPNVSRELKYQHTEGRKVYDINETQEGIHYYHNMGNKSAATRDLQIAKGYTYSAYLLDNVRWVSDNTSGVLKNVDNIKHCSAYVSLSNEQTSVDLTHNQLKIRFNDAYNPNLKDIIKNVCVFVTREIDYLDFVEPYNSKFEILEQYNKLGLDRGIGYRLEKSVPLEFVPKQRDAKDIIKDIENLSMFYKIKSYPYDSISKGDWKIVDMEEGVLSTLTEQTKLNIEAFSRDSFTPQTSLMYNGRLHIANYAQEYFRGFPMPYFYAHESYGQYKLGIVDLSADSLFLFGFIEVTLDVNGITSKVYRALDASVSNKKIPDLNPILSYPSANATTMRIVLAKSNGSVFDYTFNLTRHPFFNMSYFVSPDLKPINITPNKGTSVIPTPKEYNNIQKIKNGLKVSSVDNPLFFPHSQSYKAGNGTILGLATNEVAVSTGQQGDAPLYIFCTDGIYGLFVDTTGELAYPNARPLSRDICNNPYSITPIDGGILFSTDIGLMMISGSKSKLLSEAIDGDPFYFNQKGYDYNENMTKCFSVERIAKLNPYITKEHFRDYIRGSVIGYNYFDSEIYVCNKHMPYTYVYSNGAWTKRNKTYVNAINAYPRLFLSDGKNLYDTYPDNDISGYEKVAILTRPYQFSEESFKQNYRTILRGQYRVDKVGSYDDIVLNLDDIDGTPRYEEVSMVNKIDKEINISTNNYTFQDIDLDSQENRVIEVRESHKRQTIYIDQSLRQFSNFFVNKESVIRPTEDNLKLTFSIKGELLIIDYVQKNVQTPTTTTALRYYVGFYECYVWIGNGTFDPSKYTEEELLANENIRKVRFSFICNQGYRNVTIQPIDVYVPTTSYNSVVVINQLPSSYDIYIQLNADTMIDCHHFLIEDGSGDMLSFYNSQQVLRAQDDIYNTLQPVFTAPLAPYYIPTDQVKLTNGENITLEYQGVSHNFCYNGISGDVLVSYLINNIDSFPSVNDNNIVDKDIYITNQYLRVSTPSGIFNIIYNLPTPSLINSVALYNNILNGIYETPNAFNNHINELTNGDKVNVIINGVSHKIIYLGNNQITDEELVMNIDKGLYPEYIGEINSESALVSVESTYPIIKDVTYKFHIYIQDVKTYEGMLVAKVTSMVSISDIINETPDFFSKDIPTYNTKLSICIPEKSSFSITYQGKLYEGVFTTTINNMGDLINALNNKLYVSKSNESSVCGLYLFGSYDCKRWGLLGAKENIDEFKDIGLLAHRCDVKYFRLLFIGQISRDSYIEYIDTINSNKIMSRKIR